MFRHLQYFPTEIFLDVNVHCTCTMYSMFMLNNDIFVLTVLVYLLDHINLYPKAQFRSKFTLKFEAYHRKLGK